MNIIKDTRLRECDYGDLTKRPSKEVEPAKAEHITFPFPNGESYEMTAVRMKDLLKELLKNYEGRKVMIIGHRATQYGLEQWINKMDLKEVATAPWKWQPGWTYLLENI